MVKEDIKKLYSTDPELAIQIANVLGYTIKKTKSSSIKLISAKVKKEDVVKGLRSFASDASKVLDKWDTFFNKTYMEYMRSLTMEDVVKKGLSSKIKDLERTIINSMFLLDVNLEDLASLIEKAYK